jgi:hypothetical protein
MTKNVWTRNSCPGLTLSEALSDPLVRAVMRADKIDPPHYEAFLRRTAGELAQRGNAWQMPKAAAAVEVACC